MLTLNCKTYDEYPTKKFIDALEIDEWEVETESGWVDIKAIGQTIEYKIWKLLLANNKELKAADKHIVITYDTNLQVFTETFLCDLQINDLVLTDEGLSNVISIEETQDIENMYDLELYSDNKTYFTNGILSHNSMWLCNMAEKSSILGYNTAYITLELQEELVAMRMGSNMLNIPIDNYEEISKDENYIRTKLNKLHSDSFFPLGKLHIKEFPASTAGVPDIESYLRKTEEILGIKFKNVFVDYINIMKNWRNPNSENTYMKIKQICEDLRAMGSRNGWTIISVTQTNRGGIENSDMSVTDISESIGLLQTVDILFGIITNPEMKAKGEYYLKCLANRVTSKENTKKRFTIDWEYCRIREDETSQIEECNTNDTAVANMSKQPYNSPQRTNTTASLNNPPTPAPVLTRKSNEPKSINLIDPSSSLSFTKNAFNVEKIETIE